MLRAILSAQLAQAESNPRPLGGRDNGIRARLDRFLDHGLPLLLRDAQSLDRVLTHADLTVDNVLHEKSSGKLTALLDFDFAQIASVAEETLRSLGYGIGHCPNTRDGNEEAIKLRDAMLHGFPEPMPANADGVDWVAAKAWDDAIQSRGLQRPATIPNMSVIADMLWLSSQILPFRLCNEVLVARSTEAQLTERKAEGEARLDKFLSDYGY